jgi:hypothetical protein
VNTWGITEGVTYPFIVGLSSVTPPVPTPPPPAPPIEIQALEIASRDTVVGLEVAADAGTGEPLGEAASTDGEEETEDGEPEQSGEKTTHEDSRGEKIKNFCN